MVKLEKNFGEVSNISITALVDNMTDMLLKSTDEVKRYTQESGKPLLAEHGLSFLIEIRNFMGLRESFRSDKNKAAMNAF